MWKIGFGVLAASTILNVLPASAQPFVVAFTEQTDGFEVVTEMYRGPTMASFGTTLRAFEYNDQTDALDEYWGKISVFCPDSSSQYNYMSDFWVMNGSSRVRDMTYDEVQRFFPSSRVWKLRGIVCDGDMARIFDNTTLSAFREGYLQRQSGR